MLSRRTGIFLIILGALVISPVGAIIADLDHVSPAEILFLRCVGVAAFFFLIITGTSNIGAIRAIRLSGLSGIVAAGSMAAALACSIFAFQHTSVARTLLLFALAPLLAAVLARFFLKERLAKATLVALAISLVGLVLIVLGGREFDGGHSPSSIAGDFAALCGSFFYASFAVALRAGKLVDMRPAMLVTGVIGAAFGSILFVWGGEQISSSVADAGLVIAIGFALTGGAFLLFTIGSKSVSSAEFTMISLSEILFGSIWAWAFLGQGISGLTLAGGVLFITALLVDVRFAGSERPDPAR